MTIDFTSIARYDEVCRGYEGYSLEPNETGRWIEIENVIEILRLHGIEVRTAETIEAEKFEAEMVEKFGKNWRE